MKIAVGGLYLSESEQTQFESLKGGLSGAMKRAAVQWGIGRYLYNLEENFVEVSPNKSNGAVYINDKKTNVKGYWMPPQLPDWALPENERKGQNFHSRPQNQSSSNQSKAQNQGANQTNPTPNQRSQSSNSKQGKEFNRDAAIKAIGEYLNNTGLLKHPGWIMPLFKRINPDIKQTTLDEVYKGATERELTIYAKILRPVNDLVNVVNFHKIPMEDALNYVQILCPEAKIESLFSCFMNLTFEKVKEVNEFIKEDKQKGKTKTA